MEPAPRYLLDNNICKFNRQHVCLVCTKKGCKQLLHEETVKTTPGNLEKNLASKLQAQFDCLCSKLENVIPKPPPSSPACPPDSKPPSNDFPLFGMPALVTDSVEVPDLSKKYIMWEKVKSAGIELSLPVDSCCPVSLCSLNHAKRVQESHPELKMTKLAKPVATNVPNVRCYFTRGGPPRHSHFLGSWEILSTHHVGCP